MLDATLLGCSGTVPLPYRGLSALFVRSESLQLLIDCGEGTQVQGRACNKNILNIDLLLLTHLHSDHHLGIPGVLASMANTGRIKPLTVIGPSGTTALLKKFMSILSKLPFMVVTFELKYDRSSFTFPFATITAYALRHSVTCYGYTIQTSRPARIDVDRMSDSGLPQDCWTAIQQGIDVKYEDKVFTKDELLGEDRKGFKIAYATDTGYCDNLLKLGKGADLLYLDGMYVNEDQISNSGRGIHMTFEEAAKVAKMCECKKAILTHFSPTVNNPSHFIGPSREIFPNIICGFDGYYEVLQYSPLKYEITHYVNRNTFKLIQNGSRSYVVLNNRDLTIGSTFVIEEKGAGFSDKGALVAREANRKRILVRVSDIAPLSEAIDRRDRYATFDGMCIVNFDVVSYNLELESEEVECQFSKK